MNEEQQRIAIAEFCGWTIYGSPDQMIGRPKGYGFNDGPCLDLPDYLNDLNAIHEAEKILFERNDWSPCIYEERLENTTSAWGWHATAAQRAEALIRTLGLGKID